jgi:hypothetical protein
MKGMNILGIALIKSCNMLLGLILSFVVKSRSNNGFKIVGLILFHHDNKW